MARPYIDDYNVTNATCPLSKYLGQYTGIGTICPPGTYCEPGSSTPKSCLPGTYNDEKGQRACKSCPEGYYCLSGANSFKSAVCPSGFYCPNNTKTPNEYPCPPGTYNNMTQQKSSSSCISCPPGKYCEGHGNTWPTGDCHAGWYCNGSATTNQTTSHGGRCEPGYYCPQGSPGPVKCDGGNFCDVAGLDKPTGNCTAGYFCRLQARRADPTDGTTGNVCPRGRYCPTGTRDPIPCTPGTYNDAPQATNSSACKLCTRGKYCNGTGLETPDGSCAPGWYCPPGQSSRTPSSYPCPPGHRCLEGVDSPERCPSGYYQNEPIKDSCKTCPEKYYCNATNAGVVNYALYLCPAGHYCPNGTRFAEEFPCDYGTFSNAVGLARQDQCSQCLGGYYCGEKGLTAPKTPCSSGYFCKKGMFH